MAKLGRPFVYQSDAEKPVTVSLRIPRDLYDQAQRYVKMHLPMTLTDLLLDGLRLSLETPADPRDIILSDDNTVMQEVQEMIRAAVQTEIGKLNTFMGSALDALRPAPAPAPEAPAASLAALSYDDNTVIQEEAPRRPGRKSTLRQPIIDLLRNHPEGLSAEQIRGHLSPQRPIGDVLQGMRTSGVVRTQGKGRDMRYFVA
jgi:hypothetical protein